jgi:hypothetical protein
MDFHQLLARMQELDRPVGEQLADECGAMPMTPPAPTTPSAPPPSMSINMNAQGMESIADILKLIAKVNLDTAPEEPSLPTMSVPPSIMNISSARPSINALSDLSDEPSDEPNDDGPIVKFSMDKSGKKEEFANEPDEDYMGMDSSIRDGNDLNKPKKTFPKVAGGDNPMQRMESTDLRAQIRAELLQRLAEAKGEK